MTSAGGKTRAWDQATANLRVPGTPFSYVKREDLAFAAIKTVRKRRSRMNLPRRNDETSQIFWRMIDEAAIRVKQLADRLELSASSSQPTEQAVHAGHEPLPPAKKERLGDLRSE